MTLINGREHDWSDVKIYFMGIPAADIKNINYRDAQEVELQYSSGTKPYGAGKGNYSVEGDMELTLEEFRKFAEPAAKLGRKVYDYAPFPIVVSFADKVRKTEGDPPREFVVQEFSPTKVHVIKDVMITNVDESKAQNDKELTVKISFKAADLVRE
jgi:hypothetical protein